LTEYKSNLASFSKLIDDAKTVLVLQPEKPDSDSLCSSLILEHLLGDLGKTVVLYSEDQLPPYINYFPGADRLDPIFPKQFDIAILVDCGSPSQITRTLEKHQGRLASKPFVIIDHHAARTAMPFPTIDLIVAEVGSTGELLVQLAEQLKWKLNADIASLVIPSIMADTLGLTTPNVTADTIETVAKMVRLGANLAELNKARLEAGAMDSDILTLKGKILQNVTYHCEGKLALVTIEPEDLKEYAKRYDPSALVIFDMQHVRGVEIAVVIRNYAPKLKLSFRSNRPLASDVAKGFDGGGHPQAAGATVEAGNPADVSAKVIAITTELLAHETI
jgi:phosphoesterase RecJ-like protein